MKRAMSIVRWLFAWVVLVSVLSCGGPSYKRPEATDSYEISSDVENQLVEEFPGQSAIILLDHEVHTYSFDETEFRRLFAVKVLTEEGIDEFGDFLSDTFNKKQVKYKLEAAVISPDGKKKRTISSDEKRKVDIGDRLCQYRIAFPSLEVGSIIEIRETFQSSYGVASGHRDFASNVPTVRSELIFRVPKGLVVKFNFTSRDSVEKPVGRADGRYHAYAVRMEALPPYVNEKFMSRNHIGNPSAFYYVAKWSIYDVLKWRNTEITKGLVDYIEKRSVDKYEYMEWDDVTDMYREYFDHVGWTEDERRTEYRQVLDDFVLQLEDRDRSDLIVFLDGVLAAFHERFQSIDDDFFYPGANPEESFVLGEGGPFELAYLLKRVLEKLGLKPSILIVREADWGMLDERSPDWQQVNHPLLLVEKEAQKYWIDPYSPGCGVNQLSWKRQGVKGLWVPAIATKKGFEFGTTPMTAALSNRIESWDDVAIDEDGNLSGTSRITLTGQYLLNVRRLMGIGEMSSDDERLIAFLDAQCGLDIDREDLEIEINQRDTLRLSFDYSVNDFGQRSGDFMNLDFAPWCSTPVEKAFDTDSRHYDIEFPFMGTRIATVKITIPPSSGFVDWGHTAEQHDDVFSYSRVCFEDGNAVVFRRHLGIKRTVIPVGDYTKEKELIESILKHDSENVVLRLDG